METNNEHEFTVTTSRDNVYTIRVTGTAKQARAKLGMKLMRLRTQISPERVESVSRAR